MKFPISTLDREAYVAKVTSLLNEEGCVIFLDTNILILIFKLYSSARNEFYTWLDPLIDSGRVKIPAWVVHEYSSRFIRNKTNEYFSPLSLVNTTEKNFSEIKSFLKMHVDSHLIQNTSYNSRESYLEDLDTIEEKLKNIKVATKNKTENYITEIHNQLIEKLEGAVLPSNIFKIAKEVESTAGSRFRSGIPPGFMDSKEYSSAGKDYNSTGDLIIWTEILKFCKEQQKSKAILITNDNKKDWMYSPFKIKHNDTVISNKHPQFKIADPRLIYEFKLHTDSDEFFIINSETLAQILVSEQRDSFLNLGTALQLVISETQAAEEGEEIESLSETIEETPEDISIRTTSYEQSQDEQTVEESALVYTSEYSHNAIADNEFSLNVDSLVGWTISRLKSHDWYKQNDGLTDFRKKFKGVDRDNQQLKNELFVLGRNIYQAACGGAFQAIEMVQDLKKYLFCYGDFVVNHIYSGMYFEVYFDSKGEFRDVFKASLIDELEGVSGSEKLTKSRNFILSILERHKSKLIILPFEKKTIILEISGGSSTRRFADLFEENIFHITSIKYEGKELLHERESPYPQYREGSLETLRNYIKQALAIPISKQQISFEQVVDGNSVFAIKDDTELSYA